MTIGAPDLRARPLPWMHMDPVRVFKSFIAFGKVHEALPLHKPLTPVQAAILKVREAFVTLQDDSVRAVMPTITAVRLGGNTFARSWRQGFIIELVEAIATPSRVIRVVKVVDVHHGFWANGYGISRSSSPASAPRAAPPVRALARSFSSESSFGTCPRTGCLHSALLAHYLGILFDEQHSQSLP